MKRKHILLTVLACLLLEEPDALKICIREVACVLPERELGKAHIGSIRAICECCLKLLYVSCR